MGYTVRRPVARLVSVAAAIAALLVAGELSASAVPIPSVPPPLLTPTFIGAPAVADPVASTPIPQNPYMSPNGTNNMHNDAYASNVYSWAGPLGTRPTVTSALYGVEECATIAFDAGGRIVGLCGTAQGSVLRLINQTTLAGIASFTLPGRNLSAGNLNPLSDLCGGSYFYLDNLGRAVVETTARTIDVIADHGTSLSLVRTYDLATAVPSTDCLIALTPDWSGTIWFETEGGIVGTVNPTTGAVQTVHLGEGIFNSFATDETGGVFIVTDHALYRLDATTTGAPRVTWRQPYDRGTVQKPGQLSQGSGTTPALFGDGYVGITDNADPQMHVNVYRRSAASGGAPVCSAGVFTPGASDTENSLTAVGNGVIAENNYGYKSPASTLLGATTSPGIARVDVTPAGQCVNTWTSQVIAPTSVPKASLATGLLYVYSKPKSTVSDPWYFTAIDLRTGRTAWSRLTGIGPQWNNHYASIYLGPDGSGYIATLTGLVRIHDTP